MSASHDDGAEPGDRELVLEFESLGDNCELGLVQRRVGAEPLGLFRFAGVPLRHMLRAMDAGFEGIDDPAHVRLQPENGEYMVKLTKFDFIYHADVKLGEADPVNLHKSHVRTVGFLARKLAEDLRLAEKIFVFRQNEPLLAGDLLDLQQMLTRFGPVTLLWVREACPGHMAGTVDLMAPNLMVGNVRRLAHRQNVPDLDIESWLAMLRRAWRIWRQRKPLTEIEVPIEPAATNASIDVAFGADGNAVGMIRAGWSGGENGFTWSIGAQSSICLAVPAAADDYWLEMDVIPYVVPGKLPAQTLAVSVNGISVHRFDPLPRGVVGFSVPKNIVQAREQVEILLDHPFAASPRDLVGENDERKLAIAFRRLSLRCV